MTRALLLSCARRKSATLERVPAIDRYDGPLYRVLRSFLAARLPDPPETWVISAEFGLIRATEPIPVYDRVMTADRAAALRPETLNRFRRDITRFMPKQIFVAVGRSYQPALTDCWSTLDPSVVLKFAEGSIGGRASQLRQWLHRDSPPTFCSSDTRRTGSAELLGLSVRATAAEIMEVARKGLREQKSQATRFQTWFVPVEGAQVGPKWLVSELFGLPVSRFRTADARRVLFSLGVQVVNGLPAHQPSELES